jgi:hypothetical protein
MTVASDARLSSLDRMLDDGKVGDTFASDMFAVVDALDSSATLRRAVTDRHTEGARGPRHGPLESGYGTVADFGPRRRRSGGLEVARSRHLVRQAVRLSWLTDVAS